MEGIANRSMILSPSLPKGMLTLSWSVALSAILASFIFPAEVRAIGPFVLLTSLVLLGMPHGMMDALALLGIGSPADTISKRKRPYWLVAYAFLAGLGLWLWLSQPAVGFGVFLLATAFHWGTSEFGRVQGKLIHWLAMGMSRGMAFLAVMFSFHYAECCEMAFGTVPHAWKAPLFAFTVALIVLHLGLLYRSSISSPNRMAVDFMISLLLVALTPPLVGIAVYYMFFHSLRYFQWFEPEVGGSSTRFAHLLAIACLPLILMAVTGSITAPEIQSEELLTSGHLRLLGILTLPHMFLVFYYQKTSASSVDADAGSMKNLST